MSEMFEQTATQLVKRASVLAVRVREQGWDDVVANVIKEEGQERQDLIAAVLFVMLVNKQLA